MIHRDLSLELSKCAADYPVVTILGPRQSGKTTLVKACFPNKAYFSLEDPDVRAAAEADPRGFLSQCDGGGILDEIQILPNLLSYIQGIVDNKQIAGHFILTGSHQTLLHQSVTQSLAGRTAMLALWPLSISELRQAERELGAFELIASGFFPRKHKNEIESRRFYNDYLQTYVERDVRSLIRLRDLSAFQSFLTLLAGRVGQILNYTSLSNDVGVSATTIKEWISVLKASFIAFELQPYFANIRKRVVKSPKIYFTDVGLAASLLGIHDSNQASRDPVRGNLYENLVIADILKDGLNQGIRPEAYFFRDSNGNEVDLLIKEEGKLIPIEIKSAATFSINALKGLTHFKSLDIDRVQPGFVLYNGDQEHQVNGVRVFNPLRREKIWNTLT